MKAKTADHYFTELQQSLLSLTSAEQADVLQYYLQYAKSNQLITYEQLCQELGYPKRLARQILADYSICLLDNNLDLGTSQQSKHHLRLFWLIVLGIIASPITLPVIIVLLVLLTLIVLVVLTFVLVIAIGLISGSVTVIMAFVGGIEVFSQSTWSGLYFICVSVAGLGLLLVLLPSCWWLVINLVHLGLKISKYLGRKVIIKRHKYKEARL